jgi:cytochrome c556
MARFGFRVPSLKKRLSARTSVKRYVRSSLGLKAPRGWGWITNPKKAAYNRVYNRTTRGCLVMVVAGLAAVSVLVAAIAADSTEKRRALPRRPPVQEKQRAAAPTGWDKMVAEAFFEDAFSVVGQRPANEGAGQLPAPPVPQQRNEFDRALLMKSLAKAEESIAEAVASEKTFKQNAARLAEQIDIITGIASELKEADPDYKADEDYQRFVQLMRASAESMRAAVKQTSHESAGVSFGKLKQSCDSCHRTFR